MLHQCGGVLNFFTPLPPGLCKFYLCEVHFEFLLAAAGGELWSSCKRETDWVGAD